MPKAKQSHKPANEPDGFHLLITLTSAQHTPPEHTVVLRTSQSEWRDVTMNWTGKAWRAELRSTEAEGPLDIEFKFVLDGERWMTGWNQSGRTERPPATLDYDEGVRFD